MYSTALADWTEMFKCHSAEVQSECSTALAGLRWSSFLSRTFVGVGSYPNAEMPSVYSTSLADRATTNSITSNCRLLYKI